MKAIKKWLMRRRVRRLAEKCLTGQSVCTSEEIQQEIVNSAIMAAARFYNTYYNITWEEIGI